MSDRQTASIGTPLVFIYALVNRPYILDLKKGRSVVANFVDRGFDTYLVDWGVPINADRHLTLDDYINGYMVNVMDFLRERTGAANSQRPGLLHGRHHERHVHRAASGVGPEPHPLAAPIDFSTNDGLLNLWSRSRVFRRGSLR